MAGRVNLPRKSHFSLSKSLPPIKMTEEEKIAKQKSETITKHAAHFLEVMAEGFGMRHGEANHSYESRLVGLAERWSKICKDSGLGIHTILKWMYANLFSTVMDQELIDPPAGCTVKKCTQLLGGDVGHFVKNLLHSAKRKKFSRRAEIGQTLLMMKKGSPLPGDEVVEEAIQKHHRALTNKNKGDLHLEKVTLAGLPGDCEDDMDSVLLDAKISVAISDVVEEVFGGRKFCLDDGGKDISFPSIRGHYDSAAWKGGAAFALSAAWTDRRHWTDGLLFSMNYHPHSGVIECRRDLKRASKVYLKQYERVLRPNFRVFAQPVFIKESLKVRPVTVGSPEAYHAIMPMQKFLFQTLRLHPTFQLIGEPISEANLSRLLGLPLVQDVPEGSWLSGDYTAATDNLRRCLTDHCWKEICRVAKIPLALQELGLKCLTQHMLDYSTLDSNLGVVEQGNGQLMGSPLSFPILCLINAALCKLSFEEGRELDWNNPPVRLRDLPILINGDDCVMWFTLAQKAMWSRITTHAGLEPSIGKCYWAKSWLQMNSELFYVEDGFFKRAFFLNFGLCKDFSSKGGERRTWMDLGSLHAAFIRGCRPGQETELSAVFRRCQKDLIASAPPGISWSLPVALGGLGVALPDEGIPPCKRALQLATYLISKTVERKRAARPYLREDLTVPEWVRHGLRDASAMSIVADCPTLGQALLTAERPVIEDGASKYGKKLCPESYTPWLWNRLRTDEHMVSIFLPHRDEDPDYIARKALKKSKGKGKKVPVWLQSSRKCAKEWSRVWNDSGKVTPYPLDVIRAWTPPTSSLPGGLSAVMKTLHCPTGLMSRLIKQATVPLEPLDPKKVRIETTLWNGWIVSRGTKGHTDVQNERLLPVIRSDGSLVVKNLGGLIKPAKSSQTDGLLQIEGMSLDPPIRGRDRTWSEIAR